MVSAPLCTHSFSPLSTIDSCVFSSAGPRKITPEGVQNEDRSGNDRSLEADYVDVPDDDDHVCEKRALMKADTPEAAPAPFGRVRTRIIDSRATGAVVVQV